MIDSPHVTYTADMFGNSSELWARNYALGLFRSANGIEGLRTSDINPFHPAIADRTLQPSRMVVYEITNNITNHVSWWFESEYKAAFAEFRRQRNEHPHQEHQMFLCAAVIPTSGTAEQSWKNFFSMGKHDDHNYTMYWRDTYNSWMF